MTHSPALTAAEVEALAELAKRAAVTFQAWRDSPTPEVWAASVKAEEDFRSSIDPSDVLGLLAALAERERERDEARMEAMQLAGGLELRTQERDEARRALRYSVESWEHVARAAREKPDIMRTSLVGRVGNMCAERERLRADLAARERRVAELEMQLIGGKEGARLAGEKQRARIAELEAEVAVLLKGDHIELAELEKDQTDECWTCKVGNVRRSELPDGADLPMRRAVQEAFKDLVGRYPRAIFSGWGYRWRREQLAVLADPKPAAARSEVDER